MMIMNENEVDSSCDVIFFIDIIKGNRVINIRGFVILLIVKEGYILKISDNFLDIM